MVNKGSVKNGIDQLLTFFKFAVTEQVFGKTLPLLGDQLKASKSVYFEAELPSGI